MHVSQDETTETREMNSNVVSFYKRGSKGVLAHENDMMVIKVYIRDWSVKRVLINPEIFVHVLY